MNLLIDTNILIDALKRKRGRAEYLETVLRQGHTLCFCSIVVAELYTGISQQHWPSAEALTRNFLFLETSVHAARLAGQLRRKYSVQGVALSTQDCLIAALAIDNEIMLATDNVRDFPMSELRLYPVFPAQII